MQGGALTHLYACMCICMCVQVYDDNDVGGDRLMGHSRILLSRDELRRMSTHNDAPLAAGHGHSLGEAAHGPKHYTQQLLPPWDELPGRGTAPPVLPRAKAKAGTGVGAGEVDRAGVEAATRARGRAMSGILEAQLQRNDHHLPAGGASLAPAAAAAQGGGTLAGLFSLPSASSRALGLPLPGVAELPPPRSTPPQRPEAEAGLTRQGTVHYTREDAVRGATRIGGDARRVAAETTARVREVRDHGGATLNPTRARAPTPSPKPMLVAVAQLRGGQRLRERGGAARRRQATRGARRHRAAVRPRVHGGERAGAHPGPARRGGKAARTEAVDGLRRPGVEIGRR